MTGLELLGEVKMRHPHIQRVLISGWGANLEENPHSNNAERILTKPVRVEDIVRLLSERPKRPQRKKNGK